MTRIQKLVVGLDTYVSFLLCTAMLSKKTSDNSNSLGLDRSLSQIQELNWRYNNLYKCIIVSDFGFAKWLC